MTGTVLALYIGPTGKSAMEPMASAELEAGRGIRGDRYHSLRGTFSVHDTVRPDQEVTLIESEEIDRFNRTARLSLDYGAPRRNVVTKGIRLNELVGARFYVGEVLLEGIRLCEPCSHLASLVSPEVVRGLAHRAGLRAKIVSGGKVKLSDVVALA